MKQESSSQGFGLAVFSLLLLAGAYILVFSRANAIFAALMSLLAAILGTAALIEARRANGPKMFAVIVLILAILGTLFLLGRTGSMVSKKNPTVIIKEEPTKELRDKEEKMQELEEKLEKLEEGSDKNE